MPVVWMCTRIDRECTKNDMTLSKHYIALSTRVRAIIICSEMRRQIVNNLAYYIPFP